MEMERRATFVSEEVEKHDQAVKRFQSLCDMHRVAFERPGNLIGFLVSLTEDRHFAMDFWALVGELSEGERGTLTDEEVLSVIVEGSSGHKIQTLSEEEKSVVSKLRQLLAGVDVDSPILPEPITRQKDALLKDAKSVEQASVSVEDNPAQQEGILAEPESEAIADVPKTRRTIAEALQRLEETSRELRKHLVAIEETRSHESQPKSPVIATKVVRVHEPVTRDEPQEVLSYEPEEPTLVAETITEVEPIVRRKPVREPVVEVREPEVQEATVAVQEIVSEPVLQKAEPELPVSFSEPEMVVEESPTLEEPLVIPEESRKIAEAVSRPAEPRRVEEEPVIFARRSASTLSRRGLAPAEETDDDPSIMVPLEAYAITHKKNRALGAAIVVAFLLLAGGIWFAVDKGYTREMVDHYMPVAKEQVGLFRQEWSDLKGNKPAPKTEAAKPAVPAPVPSTSAVPTQLGADKQSARLPMTDQTSPSATSASDTKDVAASQKTTPVPAPLTETGPLAPVNTAPAVGRADRALPYSSREPIPAERNAVQVSSSAMEERLVSSRVPVYPENAKALGVEGTVVVETVISSSGAVEHVRALQGDPRLRAAAEEAVLKWHYKPYLVHGRPVEAATQVHVAFRLPRR